MGVCHQDDSEAKIHDDVMLTKRKGSQALCMGGGI